MYSLLSIQYFENNPLSYKINVNKSNWKQFHRLSCSCLWHLSYFWYYSLKHLMWVDCHTNMIGSKWFSGTIKTQNVLELKIFLIRNFIKLSYRKLFWIKACCWLLAEFFGDFWRLKHFFFHWVFVLDVLWLLFLNFDLVWWILQNFKLLDFFWLSMGLLTHLGERIRIVWKNFSWYRVQVDLREFRTTFSMSKKQICIKI